MSRDFKKNGIVSIEKASYHQRAGIQSDQIFNKTSVGIANFANSQNAIMIQQKKMAKKEKKRLKNTE